MILAVVCLLGLGLFLHAVAGLASEDVCFCASEEVCPSCVREKSR